MGTVQGGVPLSPSPNLRGVRERGSHTGWGHPLIHSCWPGPSTGAPCPPTPGPSTAAAPPPATHAAGTLQEEGPGRAARELLTGVEVSGAWECVDRTPCLRSAWDPCCLPQTAQPAVGSRAAQGHSGPPAIDPRGLSQPWPLTSASRLPLPLPTCPGHPFRAPDSPSNRSLGAHHAGSGLGSEVGGRGFCQACQWGGWHPCPAVPCFLPCPSLPASSGSSHEARRPDQAPPCVHRPSISPRARHPCSLTPHPVVSTNPCLPDGAQSSPGLFLWPGSQKLRDEGC